MQATHVRVTNGNTFLIDDRYDGVLYEFHPGKERLVPIHAAALFFGWRVDDDGQVDLNAGEEGTVSADWEHVKRRWGWNSINRQKDEDLGEAVERAKKLAAGWTTKIKLVPVTMALREVPMGASGDLPAPRSTADEPLDAVEASPPGKKMKA